MMMFKCAMTESKWVVPDTMGAEQEDYPVPEQLEGIPPEWADNWWKKNLDRSASEHSAGERPVHHEVLDLFHKRM